MIRIFQSIIFWIYIKIHTMLLYLTMAFRQTELDIFSADSVELQEKDKKTTRKLHRNPLLEKFYAGKADLKYVKNYYDYLRKIDDFMKKSTPDDMKEAAKNHKINYGVADEYGRRYEHYGFFDPKHKYAGKSIKEVLDVEYEQRRTKDDDLEILYVFNNTPIEAGLSKLFNTVENNSSKIYDENKLIESINKSKTFEFPIKAYRKNEEAINKIEQLTEFLHVKKIGFNYRQLEFFIPLKFKTNELDEDSIIFKEIIDLDSIYLRNEYGEQIGFSIIKYTKRINNDNNTHDVLKFEGYEMEIVNM